MLRTEPVLNGADDVLMTNPYALPALAQAREDDIRRQFAGRHHIERHAFGRRDLRSVLFGWRRPRRAPVVLRVVLAPLDSGTLRRPATLGGQVTFDDPTAIGARAQAHLRCQQ
jgi:hypothetical protein